MYHRIFEVRLAFLENIQMNHFRKVKEIKLK